MLTDVEAVVGHRWTLTNGGLECAVTPSAERSAGGFVGGVRWV